jgi:uncharacterized protein (TIGR02145 family)
MIMINDVVYDSVLGMKLLLSLLLFTLVIMCGSCSDNNAELDRERVDDLAEAVRHLSSLIPFQDRPDTVTIDGIKAVRTGGLTWATENLSTITYCNGDTIPEIRDTKVWREAKTGAWSHYENNPAYGALYGKIYNWYAVSDPRGLCPCGWTVASDQDWQDLISFFGGPQLAQVYLMSDTGQAEGKERNSLSGFNALGGGYRPTPEGAQDESDFDGLAGGVWWSSTRTEKLWGLFHVSRDAWGMDISRDFCFRSHNGWFVGQSVRCVLLEDEG